MIHSYMRAIGFAGLRGRSDLNRLIGESVQQATTRDYVKSDGGVVVAQFDREFAPGVGLSVCGEFDSQDRFVYEYYYPYFRGTGISSEQDVTVYRLAAREAYAGICDDYRVGVSIIFYLQNMIPYVRVLTSKEFPVQGTTLTLSALATEGIILLPIYKSPEDLEYVRIHAREREELIEDAREGDEEAIETLTREDMDNYATVSRRLPEEDVFTLVDSYFMPYGVESDLYSVLGEILEVRKDHNRLTGEVLVLMRLSVNRLEFDVCIAQKDLFGEPAVGRRFKGTIWMQGLVNLPEIKE